MMPHISGSETTSITGHQIEAVIGIHLEAFKGSPNTRMGLGYVHAFFRWFVEAPEAIALCALVEETDVVGYVVGAPLGYQSSLNRKVVFPGTIGILLRPWLLFNSRFRHAITSRLPRVFKRKQVSQSVVLPTPTFSLVGIGVALNFRGQRIGQSLVHAFEKEVLRRQGRSMRLSVYVDNVVARRLYEKMGWHPLDSYETSRIMYYFKRL
jgi:ribosomal protein S18 acetylase RimI-like enzyme